MDPSYRPFDERGVAGKQALPQPWVLVCLPCSTFPIWRREALVGLVNLSVAGVDILAIWKNSAIIPILKVGKPREQSRSYCPSCCFSQQWRSLSDFSSRPSWRGWALSPPSMASNPGTQPPRPCSGCLWLQPAQAPPPNHRRYAPAGAYLRGRKDSCLYQQQVRAEVP